MVTFEELGLSDEILKAISALGFEKPTEIQIKSIPKLIMGDRDFIGLAQTGTGKTAAFGLPLLERMDPDLDATQALILAPTRELGKQITEQLIAYSKFSHHINVLAVYGGAAIVNQIKALRKTQHIIVATPGRLIDLIKRKAIKLNNLQFLVLDEADEMLNMGFKEDIDKILSYTREEKITWLFSATMPKEIKKIVKKYMEDPLEVRINAQDKVNTDIEHQFVMVRQSDKMEALSRILDITPGMRGVVFCRTKRDTQNLAEQLLRKKYKADALHGDLSQQQRDRVMNRFRSKDLQVLIATDVAARGIDVSDLTHVFHFTLPDDISYYTHRSGRTARAGRKGISISIISGKEKHRINRIAKSLDISFEQVFVPSTDQITDLRIEHWCQTIIDQKPNSHIAPELLAKVEEILAGVSKEELIGKLVAQQMNLLSIGTSKDLNDKESKGRDSGGGGGGGRGRDRRDRSSRGGRNKYKKDKSYGGKRDDKKKKHRKGSSNAEEKPSKGKSGKKKKYYT